MTITPNRDGKQPDVPITKAGRRQADEMNLEQASDTAKLNVLKSELESIQSDAADYVRRIEYAKDWLGSRWDGQTIDGLKWHTAGGTVPWPWQGASDTRTHTIAKVVGQHCTVQSYALRNMKIAAKSSRPFADISESQKATTLINWMIGTHMQMEAHRETRLALNLRNTFGASVIAVDWEQERRIDYVQVSLMTLEALTQSQGFGATGMASELQGTDLLQWQSIIADESNEESLVPFIQKFSPILTKGQARRIIRDLRELRFAEVPIPYIYLSKPRWRAMQPMVDIFFPPDADELNLHPRWTMEPERLTETELTDRIETANYDPKFVEDAINQKGRAGDGPWMSRTDYAGNPVDSSEDEKIEIWRAKYRALDRGTPVLFETIFHMNVDREAWHGPCAYRHGQFGYHDLRFERRFRPILSSKGIAEYAYTWQNEIKAQRDGRTDRTALTLRPPLLAPYQDVLKIKAAFSPGVIWPERHAGDMRWMQPPQYDPGSIEIEKTVNAAIDEHFGIFGLTVDPVLKQQRAIELGDDLLMEFKPVINQTWQLMQDYLPDEEVAAVVGGLSRPFRVSRQEIQGQYNITMTVDMRNIDQEFRKMKLETAIQASALDTTGSIDRQKLVRLFMEDVDPDLAGEIVMDQAPASEKEIQDERDKISLIIGSGMDQPLPKGANYQLRLQTLQAAIQEIGQNPATMKIIQGNPDIMKVLQNRALFFQRQMQQQENAGIGRLQVSKTFSKAAPAVAEPLALGQ